MKNPFINFREENPCLTESQNNNVQKSHKIVKKTYRNTIVRVIKNDFDIGGKYARTCAFVQQGLPLFRPQMCKLIAQYKLDGKEEITLTGSISTWNIAKSVEKRNF